MGAAHVCPLCRAPLTSLSDHERCTRCGDYPRVGGVAVLVPQPRAALAEVKARVIRGWAVVEARRREAHRAEDLTDTEKRAIEQALAAMSENLDLFERVTAPAMAAAPAVVEGSDADALPPLAPLFTRESSAWSFADLLPYFYVDWCAPRDEVRDLFIAEATRHTSDRSAALVVACGASGVVGDLAAHFGEAVGVDLSLPSLLLARWLLDGEGARVFLEGADWRGFTLAGDGRFASRATLAMADGAALPFADESFSVVVTQYLLDIVAAPHAVIREINRVLVPGGVWLHDGLPFRAKSHPSALRPRTGDAWAATAARFGFDVLELTRRENRHLDLHDVNPWAETTLHRVVHAVLRKRSSTAPPSDAGAVAAYFAGDAARLLRLVPRLFSRDDFVVQRRVDAGREVDPTLRLGDLEVRTQDDAHTADALRFLAALDGGASTASVLDALGAMPGSPRERDLVLALDALRRAGVLELLP